MIDERVSARTQVSALAGDPAGSKRCKTCGEVKPLTAYYVAKDCLDGRRGSCKDCVKGRVREWALDNREHVLTAARRRYRENRSRHRAVSKRWSENNRDKKAATNKRYEERHPERTKARQAVKNAVREGKLAKPESCQDCGKGFEKRLIHGHHEDYSKPLEVEWLCRRCHNRRHGSP